MTDDSVLNRLRERLWAGGIADPIAGLEQIAYLLLLRWLSDGDRMLRMSDRPAPPHRDGGNALYWEQLRRLEPDVRATLLRKRLVAFLLEVIPGPRFHAVMQDASFSISDPALVSEAVEAIDRLLEPGATAVSHGDVLERLLQEFRLSGRNGQFMTPRAVVEAMVELVDPRPGEMVCDPAAGTGGFLVAARRYVDRSGQAHPGDSVGFDINPSMARLATINLLLRDVEHPVVSCRNVLSQPPPPGLADVVLTNPPFAGHLDSDELDPALLPLHTSRTELAFLEVCRRTVHPRGRIATLVPQGVLFGTSKAHRAIRRAWLEEMALVAVVLLPPETFAPHAKVDTAVLLARAGATTERVWFCRLGRDPGELSDMPAAVLSAVDGRPPRTAVAERLAGQMWCASLADIRDNDWSLSPQAYRPVAEPAASDRDPLELLDEIERLESLLRVELQTARGILSRPA